MYRQDPVDSWTSMGTPLAKFSSPTPRSARLRGGNIAQMRSPSQPVLSLAAWPPYYSHRVPLCLFNTLPGAPVARYFPPSLSLSVSFSAGLLGAVTRLGINIITEQKKNVSSENGYRDRVTVVPLFFFFFYLRSVFYINYKEYPWGEMRCSFRLAIMNIIIRTLRTESLKKKALRKNNYLLGLFQQTVRNVRNSPLVSTTASIKHIRTFKIYRVFKRQ